MASSAGQSGRATHSSIHGHNDEQLFQCPECGENYISDKAMRIQLECEKCLVKQVPSTLPTPTQHVQ